jgi:hypothetical protein
MSLQGEITRVTGTHVYTMSAGWKTVLVLFGIALVAGSIGSIALVHRDPTMPMDAALVFDALLAVFAGRGALCVAIALRTRMVLTGSGIELHGLLGSRTLRTDAIAGWRSVQAARGGSWIELVPKDRSAQPLQVSRAFGTDRVFDEWVAGFPAQDALDTQRMQGDAQADPRYGSTPTERLRAFGRLARFSAALQWLTLALVIWSVAYPHPYRLVIGLLALAPLLALAIAWLSRGLVQIDQKARSGAPTVVTLLLLPPLALAMRASVDIALLDWTGLLVVASIGGVLFALTTLVVDAQQRRWPAFLLMVPFGAAWTYGLAAQLDVALDRSPAAVYPTHVIGKHVSAGKNQLRYLDLAPWGPGKWSGDESVDRQRYDATEIGDRVCVGVRAGAFGWRWYWLDDCVDR